MADDFLTPERALNDYIEEQKELAAEAATKAAKEAAQKAAQKAAKEAAKESAERTAEKAAKKLYATGMKSSVIASVLDCPVSTVRKWIGAT